MLKGLALAVEWPRQNYPDPGTVSYYYFRLQTQTIPDNHSWIPGGTAYQDAVSYGHASPSTVVEPFAALIVRVPADRLHLRAAVRDHPADRARRRGADHRLRERRPRLAWSRRTGSMMPWVTGVVLLVFPIAVADFDYRYLLPVLPFACLAAGLAFAPARVRRPRRSRPAPAGRSSNGEPQDDLTPNVPGRVS